MQDLARRADGDRALAQPVDRQARAAARVLEQHDLPFRDRVRDDHRVHETSGNRLERALGVLQPLA